MEARRPENITWFERLFLGSLLIGVIQAILTWQDSTREMSPATVLTIQGFSFALVITLTLLVSRRRSNVARQ